jgi:hypothetical protein
MVFAVPGDGRLLLSPALAAGMLALRNSLVDLAEQPLAAWSGRQETSVVGIGQDGQVRAVSVVGLDEWDQVRLFADHEPILKRDLRGDRPDDPLMRRAEDGHALSALELGCFKSLVDRA